MTVVNVFLDKPVSMESVLELVLLNAPEQSTDNPKPVVGIDVGETVEVAQKTSDAKTEFVCATQNVKEKPVDLMVAEEFAESASSPLTKSASPLLVVEFKVTHHQEAKESVGRNVFSVETAPAVLVKQLQTSGLLLKENNTALKIVVQSLESSR
jgi:hypothetical protein